VITTYSTPGCRWGASGAGAALRGVGPARAPALARHRRAPRLFAPRDPALAVPTLRSQALRCDRPDAEREPVPQGARLCSRHGGAPGGAGGGHRGRDRDAALRHRPGQGRQPPSLCRRKGARKPVRRDVACESFCHTARPPSPLPRPSAGGWYSPGSVPAPLPLTLCPPPSPPLPPRLTRCWALPLTSAPSSTPRTWAPLPRPRSPTLGSSRAS
jgi:hypothetical protein